MLIWLTMAFQAGVLNVGGFLAGQKIVSHVTGFATFSGYYLSQGENISAMQIFLLPVIFLFGAMVSGYFVDIRLKLKKKPRYYITFGLMFLLTSFIFVNGLLGNWGRFGNVSYQSYQLVMVLCFICGIQNGTISIVSNSVIRTTHLTGITTDLGLGLVRLFKKKELAGLVTDETRANLMRIGIIVSFILGSVVGGILFSRYEYFGFLLPLIVSGGLFGLMIFFQARN